MDVQGIYPTAVAVVVFHEEYILGHGNNLERCESGDQKDPSPSFLGPPSL